MTKEVPGVNPKLDAMCEMLKTIHNLKVVHAEESCPDCFCEDCTKENCGIKKLGLVRK